MGMQAENTSINCRICRVQLSSFPAPLLVAAILVMLSLSRQAGAQPESDETPWSVKSLVEFQQHLHPSLTAQDVYKLFYQAAFGGEHILADSAEVDSILLLELGTIDSAMQGEPLLERISLQGEIVRVNLRPFKHLNLSPSLLVKAMFRSASETNPDTLMFYRMWNEFSSLVRFGLLEFPAEDMREWDAKVSTVVAEPVHHSKQYTSANRPAYRVVRRNVFESVFGEVRQ